MIAFAKTEAQATTAYDCGLGQLLDGELRLQSVLPVALEVLDTPHLKRLVRQTIRQSKRNLARLIDIFAAGGDEPRREICRSTLTVTKLLLDSAQRLSVGEEIPTSFVRCLRRLQQVRLSEYCVSQSLLGCAGLNDEVRAIQDCIEEVFLARESLSITSDGANVSQTLSSSVYRITKPR